MASQSPALLRENNMRGSLRWNMFDCPVSQRMQVNTAKECFPLAERNGSKSKVNFIDMAGLNVLPHSLGTTANLDVLCACCFARLLQRLFNTTSDEVKCRSTEHLDRWSWIMCQYESRCVIRRIVTPPAFPLIVWPFTTNRPEHVTAEDEGTETLHRALAEPVIQARFSVVFSEHLTKRARREKPLKKLLASQTKRPI